MYLRSILWYFFIFTVTAVGEILEGKRAKKTVERLDFQAPKQKEKLKIGDGKYLTVINMTFILNMRFLDANLKMIYLHMSWYVYNILFVNV